MKFMKRRVIVWRNKGREDKKVCYFLHKTILTFFQVKVKSFFLFMKFLTDQIKRRGVKCWEQVMNYLC